MAPRAPKKATPPGTATKATSKQDEAPSSALAKLTPLFAWAIERLGFDSWAEVKETLNHPSDDAETKPWIGGETPYLAAMRARFAKHGPLEQAIVAADARIVVLTAKMNESKIREANPIHWKYFQYFALLATELYLAYYARVHGLDYIALRFANVYGPRQDPHGEAGVVAIFCNRLLDGRALTVFGNGEQTRDYVYAGDVARANFLAGTCDLPARGRLDARAFNIGTSIETSVNTLAETLRTVSGATAPIEYAPARAGELARSALETGKARAILGWEPQVAIADGLANTYRFFADRRARLAAGGHA